MYLRNTVGKRHKKEFKFIFGDRNLRLRDSTSVCCPSQQMMTEMTYKPGGGGGPRGSKVKVVKIRAIKGDGNPTRLLPHAKMLLVPIKFFSSAG